MKHSDLFRRAAVAALSLALAAVPALAKNGNAKVKPATAKPASATPKAKAPKAQTPKAKSQAPKMASSAGSTKSSTRATSTKGSTTRATRNTDTPTLSRQDRADNTPTLSAQPLSKAQQKLLDKPELSQRMRLRLGSDPMLAASGFKNLGQFVAAVNVSNNLGIQFSMLKGLMVNRGMSLGQAIQQAKSIEARRATSLANVALAQADDEISATSLQSVTSSKKVKDKS